MGARYIGAAVRRREDPRLPVGAGQLVDDPARPVWSTQLANTVVRYVGEALVMVVAENRHAAENALETIEVEFDAWEPVVDILAASEPGAPLLHATWDDNVAVAFTHQLGDVESAVRKADVVVREQFTIQRYVGMPLEPRCVLAEYERGRDRLTSWSTTQVPHFIQQHEAEAFSSSNSLLN